MPCCKVKTIWSDDLEIVCKKDIMRDGDVECYLHKKYFEKSKRADGELHYTSGPAPADRRQVHFKGLKDQCYIVAVFSPGRNIRREIGDEYSE